VIRVKTVGCRAARNNWPGGRRLKDEARAARTTW
jgi:hypothetical protein